MTEALIEAISSTVELPGREADKLLQMVKPTSWQAGDYFIKAGQIPQKFGFVVNGLFRYLYINRDGREYTKAFFPESTFISSYTAMTNRMPSFLYIQALEEAEILEINYRPWLELRQSHTCWDKFLLCLLEKGYAAKEKRERELLLLDAESRYRNFIREFPHLESRIKQHIIASYLGITPIALSRIRKKMGLVNPG